MHAEGKDNVFLRHEACAAASRAGLEALGFDLLADASVASKTVTAVHLPEGHDWKPFNSAIKSHGVVLAGGQGKLTGKIFRLGHLGSVTVDEILGVIAVLERVSLEQGRRIEVGRAVGAAQAAAVGVQTGGPGARAEEPAAATVPA
jgi:aspartate aminotransferase-like enzyme